MPVGTFTQTDGTTNINNILTQEANRIGQDIYKQTLHVSPWIDLIPKAKFMDGMGYTQNTLVYDRTLPTYGGASNQDNVGLQWTSLAGSTVADNTNLNSQALIAGASVDRLGPQDAKSYIDFTRKLKSFNLKRAVIESPRVNVDDLRFAAYRAEQLRAITELLKESSRYCWEERYRDEYDRLCDNLVVAKATGTAVTTGQEGIQTEAIDPDANTAALTPTANISNKITDKIYNILQRAGAGTDAYGRENGRPVYGLVLSSEASYALMTESGFRDDVRYSARVDELIAPLGVEKSFRGWYHLIDDLAPRFNISGSAPNQDLVRVPAYTISSGVIIPNTSYETATYEAAYVLHKSVMESQIPEPITSAGNGITFNPVNYRGEFKWTNIPNADINPDGTIGFFRGVLTSASKPIKTNYGYVFLFDRTSTTPAA